MYITISFKKSNKIVKAFPGRSHLYVARENDIRIPSPCGGNSLCGGCRIRIIEGNDKIDVSAEEYNKLTDEQIEENWRLACSFIPYSNITVEA